MVRESLLLKNILFTPKLCYGGIISFLVTLTIEYMYCVYGPIELIILHGVFLIAGAKYVALYDGYDGNTE